MKSRPEVALVPRPRCRAADFLNELGELMFPEKWSRKYIGFLQTTPYESGMPGAEVFSVQEQLMEAMRHGIGYAEVELTDLVFSTLYADCEDRIGPGGEVARRLTPGIYSINVSYWNEDVYDPDEIDWTRSTISLPADYVDIKISGVHMIPKNGEVRDAPFYIAEPDLLLSKAVEIPPVATREIISRYGDTQRSVWLEIMGVTWRLLAIEKPQDEHGLQAELIEKVRHYIRVHQLDGPEEAGVSDSAMKVVVGKILRQWREGNTRDSVLVSSTPN